MRECTAGTPEARAFRGRTELLDLALQIVDGRFDMAAGPVAARCRHALNNICLFGQDVGRAKGYAYLTVTAADPGAPPRWLASGTYCDDLVKGSGGWRIKLL